MHACVNYALPRLSLGRKIDEERGISCIPEMIIVHRGNCAAWVNATMTQPELPPVAR